MLANTKIRHFKKAANRLQKGCKIRGFSKNIFNTFYICAKTLSQKNSHDKKGANREQIGSKITGFLVVFFNVTIINKDVSIKS
jgi:hypothetical protein